MITRTMIWLDDRSQGLIVQESVRCIDGVEERVPLARNPLLLAGLIDIDVTFLSR